jgi:DHA3 family macrolide efflux protein-like MFS transporter
VTLTNSTIEPSNPIAVEPLLPATRGLEFDRSESANSEPPAPPGSSSTRSWLANVALFLTGQSLSILGSSLVTFALTWYVTLKTGSGAQFSVLLIASALSMALMAIPGGVWADRYWRKALMIGADAAVAVVTTILAVFMLNGVDSLWLIAAALALRGLGSGVQSPAVNAAIPQIVPADKLLRVNSFNQALQAGIMVLSPAVAVLLIGWLPLGWILMVDVMTAILGITLTVFIRVPRLKIDPQATHGEGIRGYFAHAHEAFTHMWQIPGLRRATIAAAVILTCVVPLGQMTPVFIVRLYDSQQWMLAASETAFCIGMVVGGIGMSAWGGLRNRMTMLMIAWTAFCSLTVLLGLMSNIWSFIVVAGLMGLTLPMINTPLITALQELIPEQMMGRVMSVVVLVNGLCQPLGMAVLGPLADHFNITWIAIVCGAAGLIFLAALAIIGGPGSQLYAPDGQRTTDVAVAAA